AFAPDGRSLVSVAGDRSLSSSHGQAIQWEVPGGRPLLELFHTAFGVLAVAFSRDRKLLALGTGAQVTRLYDAEKMAGRLLLPQPLVVRSLSFAPDGQTLASVSSRRVLLWRRQEGKRGQHVWTRVASLAGHEGRIGAVVFSPDGATLATGSWDGTVRLWD